MQKTIRAKIKQLENENMSLVKFKLIGMLIFDSFQIKNILKFKPIYFILHYFTQ